MFKILSCQPERVKMRGNSSRCLSIERNRYAIQWRGHYLQPCGPAKTIADSQAASVFSRRFGLIDISYKYYYKLYFRKCNQDRRRPAYFHNPGSEPLRAITTGRLLDLAAERYGTRKAIVSVHEGQELTFHQVKEQVSTDSSPYNGTGHYQQEKKIRILITRIGRLFSCFLTN